MNPILLGRHVEQGLRELVHSTLNSTSPGFAGTVERFLNDPNHFMKGPWVTIDLPYKNIENANGDWTQPFPQIPLKFAPYIHQAKAFQRLTAEKPLSTLVATGTGSGKTEAYLWPILDYCRQHSDKPGIKAILIYPMNALATDQARRVAAAITANPALKGIRAGIYAGKEPQYASDVVSPDSLITRRETLRQDPPDILLTNYKMLDYLLLRGDDLPLWSQNDKESLRFLVVDEIHTFDGAQGADLALLIRRLKHRVGTPDQHLVCIGSSATLVSGNDADKELISYAQTIFGEPFLDDAVIRETRVSASDALKMIEYFDVPDPKAVLDALKTAENGLQTEAAYALASCLFDDKNDPDLAPLYTAAPSSADFRLTLGRLIKEHWLGQRIIETISHHADHHLGPVSMDALSLSLAQAKPLRHWDEVAVHALTELIVSLISWARSGQPDSLRPLFNLRIQVWLREMARMVASLPYSKDGQLVASDLHHADDLDAEQLATKLPIVHCQRCGSTAHIGRENIDSASYHARLDVIYDEFFDGSSADKLRLFYTEKLLPQAKKSARQLVSPGLINPDTLEFELDERQLDRTDGKIPVWMYTPASDGRVDRTCPACGHAQGLIIFGIRSARMVAAVSSILFTSQHNEENAIDKPRFLLFSDSVQDAAQRGAVTEVRNTQSVVQKALYSALSQQQAGDQTAESLFLKLPEKLHKDMGADKFTALFIPRNLTWRRAYQELVSADKAIESHTLLRGIEWRLGWSIFENLTYKSHLLSSLEGHGVASADIAIEQLSETAEKFAKQLKNEFSGIKGIDSAQLCQFIFGVLRRLRKQGSVTHSYLVQAIKKSSRGGQLGDFAAGQILGLERMMPTLNPRNGLAPVPVSPHKGLMHFDNLNSDALTNWFRDWFYRFLFRGALTPVYPRDLYQLLFDRLVEDGWLLKVSREGDDDPIPRSYLLKSTQIYASTDVAHFACDRCHRREVALSQNTPWMDGMKCSRLGCAGVLQATDRVPEQALLRALNSDRTHRVVAREHTGLLDTDTRLAIEKGFIDSERPWAPNLISATPTLEMGIDIGDLSTLLLCSVPPEEVNYVQRMGRSGRRDGNALNLVLANARPHDLQFWEDPSPMLKGEVRAPGVHIAAESVLVRQIMAFTLDAYVVDSAIEGDFGKVSDVRKRLEAGHTGGFPMDWAEFIGKKGEALADAFIGLLPNDVREQTDLVERLKNFVVSDKPKSMRCNIRKAFKDADKERNRLVEKREELTKEKRRLKTRQAEFTPEEFKKRGNDIEQHRKEINSLIRQGIDEVPVIKFLTNRGHLPNYAFPEEGIKLTSLLSRRERESDAASDEDNLLSVEYQRPASSALSEFALGQTFYANGRQVKISRLEMSLDDLMSWRFCPRCSHVENTTAADSHNECPRCGDDMWADSGSVREVVELKSVLAISSEEKAAIRDTDRRTQVHFDRSMVPCYEPSDITAAWFATEQKASAPFGYELISHCTFRDFNFGKRTDAPMGQKIAGTVRPSRPFKICRHCGTQQSPFLATDEIGKHPPSCDVVKNDEGQPDWLRHSYLMRSFDTEAIRVIIPVAGKVNYDEIKSFVAAINLGMRHYFAGRVDHIRSTVVEAQIDGLSTVRSLYLYDTVPGGSGYLRQLADSPSAMEDVIKSAFKILDSCPCAKEDKSGCYRCVKSYRSQFGPGEPDRNLARSMMEGVLNHWKSLRKSASPLDDELSNSLAQNELESLFLESLKDEFGDNALTPKVVGDGARGFILSTGKDNPVWMIEQQVQMRDRFKNMPQKVIDFLMTPIDSSVSKPIVVETDGIRYHADSVSRDILDRLEMIRSGEVMVWSLSWHDLKAKADKAKANKPFSNPLAAEILQPESAGSLGKVLSHFKAHEDRIKQAQESGSFALLIETLKSPDAFKVATGILLRGIVGRGGSEDQLFDGLRAENLDWIKPNLLAQRSHAPNLDLYISLERIQPSQFEQAFDDIHALIKFDHPPVHHQSEITEQFIQAFRGLWRAVNLLQVVNGLHIEFPELDTLNLPPPTSQSGGTDADADWAEVHAEVLEEYHPLIEALIAARVDAPDTIGREFMEGNRVLGGAEIGWAAQDLWITDDDTIKQENVIHWDLTAKTLPAVVAGIVSRLANTKEE